MNKIIPLFLILLCSVSLALAEGFTMPHPIHGVVTQDGTPVSNLEVVIKSINSGIETSSRTNEDGFFMVDLGNIDTRYRDGDKVIINLKYCSSLSQCSRTVYVSGGENGVVFDIFKDNLPTKPVDSILVKYLCWNNQPVESLTDCPIQPVVQPIVQPEPVVVEKPVEVIKIIEKPVEVVKIQCVDGSIVDSEDKCPEKSNSWIYWVVGVLAALFGGAGGLKFYNGKFKHLHNGLNGYHDPNTKHSNPKYCHRAWKESALGCISDVKKIQKGIDLSKGG